MEVWLLKVAAVAVAAVVVEASIPGWWMLFWVKATFYPPEAFYVICHPSIHLSHISSVRLSIRASELLFVAIPQTPCTRTYVLVLLYGEGMECSLNRYSAMHGTYVCVCVCKGVFVHVFTVQSATLAPQTHTDKNKAFVCSSFQSSGLSPAHFLSLESTICRLSRYSPWLQVFNSLTLRAWRRHSLSDTLQRKCQMIFTKTHIDSLSFIWVENH